MFPQLFILVNKNEMVLLNYFQLEWILYFAVAIYGFLFTTHPEVDWVLKRDLCRVEKELWIWLPLPSYPKPIHKDLNLAPSTGAAGSPALFLSNYLDFLACPWPWIVTQSLAGVHQSVIRACCHHHPACLGCLGCCGAAPTHVGTEPLHHGPQHPGPEEPAVLHITLPVSSDLLGPELGTKKIEVPTAPAGPQTSTLHPELPLLHTTSSPSTATEK